MDFSQIGIKKFLSLVVALLLSQILFAQNEEIAFRYEVEILNKEYLSVKIFKSKELTFPLVFKLPSQVPNFYIKESVLNEISEFYTSKNEKTTPIETTQNEFEIKEDFDFLTYKVKFKTIDKEDFPAVQTFAQNDYCLLNFANFLGGFNESSIKLKISKNNKLEFEKIGKLKDFYSSPVCIGCQTKSYNDKDFSIKVNYNKTDKQFQKYISEALEAYKMLGFQEKLENKTMIFVLDSISNNEGAIAHKNYIVFNFNSLDKYIIQKTILHEMIHWVVPDLKSWLNESVAEFLAIKLMLKSGLISEQKFLDVLSKKMKTADTYKSYSLNDLFKNKTKLSVKQNYQALYSKGAILAFVLDAKLFDKPYINISLEEYVLKGISTKNEKISLDFIQDLVAFEKEFIIENKTFSYNKFLNQFGILYEENTVLEIKAKQNILLKEIKGKIIILDNGGIKLLQEKDILLKLNGAKEIEEIKEKLMEKSQKSSCFVVLREGIKKKIKISNKESLFIRSKFKLSFFEERTEEQKENWKQYID